ncbi:hypothetical protein D3C71_2065950 [compost metagenome]
MVLVRSLLIPVALPTAPFAAHTPSVTVPGVQTPAPMTTEVPLTVYGLPEAGGTILSSLPSEPKFMAIGS